VPLGQGSPDLEPAPVRSRLLLGIDLGTTRIRVAAFDPQGRQIVARGAPSRLREIHPGRVEQPVEEVRAAADAAIQAVTSALGTRADDVAAIGVTGQMGGITAVDSVGQALMPYDSPLDLRCVPYFERHMLPHLPTILAATGACPEWGQKLLYWHDEHPALWDRIARFTTLAGLYAAELVGLPADQAFTDPTYAALSGLWSGGLEWNPRLCDLVGIAADKLPRLVPPNTVVGTLQPERGAALGLPAELPVVAGTGDGMASLLGAGAVTDGVLFDLSGTASVLATCSDRFVPDPDTATLNCMPSALREGWYLTHSLFGGQAVRWFAEQFPPNGQAGPDLAVLWDERAATFDDGSAPCSLFFVPHLGGRRHPPGPAARGGWVGLTWGTRPEHLYLAILESIAYDFVQARDQMRKLLPNWDPTEVQVLGGGARSALWNQVKADILGLPIRPLKDVEFGARGVALVAGEAAGIVHDIRATAMQVEAEAAVLPRPGQHQRRERGLRAYRILDEEVERLFTRLEEDALSDSS
jgi:xylulokinase